MQRLVVSQFKTGLRHLSFCGENSGSYSLLPVRRQGHRHSDLISKNSDRRKRKVTFHKAKEEYKWKQWKEQEERILRKSGVSEEVNQRLRELDWQDFNAERRFWEHFSSNQEELYTRELEEPSSVVLNIQQLLDSVENEQLLQVLLESDKKTLQILLLKMWGFSVREIAGQMGLPEKTIYTRIERLKKKIKKVLKK